MPRKRQLPTSAADAVKKALDHELEQRKGDIKPIEILRCALAAYLAFTKAQAPVSPDCTIVESPETQALRRGTQSAVDRMLFNANYWRSAYESRIIAVCNDASNAFALLDALSVWRAHPLRLNRLTSDDVVATFERFCPPFAKNNRRGGRTSDRSGKGPLPDFENSLEELKPTLSNESFEALRSIQQDIETEASVYEELAVLGSLSALMETLPAWCLQNRIELVSGTWWEDSAVMKIIIDALSARFMELGLGDAICRYFVDSCHEALDAYHCELTSDAFPLADRPIGELIEQVRKAREAHPSFETDGYGEDLPGWLIGKEQLIWNVLICAIYGPACARPLLADSPDLMVGHDYVAKTDVITELAQRSFGRYIHDRASAEKVSPYSTYASQPLSLQMSSIAYISSISSKLDTLGYEVMPMGSCYPENRVYSLTESEVECLAILEHRRWLTERKNAGWTYAKTKNVDALESPYLVAWEDLNEDAREWNRSAVRSIPSLLASVNLAIVK